MKKISVMLCMLMGCMHAPLWATKGVIMDEFVEVGFGMNVVGFLYPLEWVENNVTTEGATVKAVTLNGPVEPTTTGIFDPPFPIGNSVIFTVRYPVISEIRDLVNAEEELPQSTKQYKLYELLGKHFKDIRATGPSDNIFLSNGKEGEYLRSVRFCFGLPYQEGFPPKATGGVNVSVYPVTGIEYGNVPQIGYILR